MILYYVRHGDPVYEPDSLTPLGQRQAEAVAKRFAVYGLDKIYASTSNRAILTAKPTCEVLKLEAELLDFANEGHAWRELTVDLDEGRRTWLFHHKKTAELFNSKEIRDLGDRWYDSPLFEGTTFKEGMLRIHQGVDELFESLGYRHDRERHVFEVKQDSKERVALFAHQGFGLLFLSSVLDIPYPIFASRFDLSHSSVTAIEFPAPDADGICRPKILQLSNDSHLFKADILRKYNNEIEV